MYDRRIVLMATAALAVPGGGCAAPGQGARRAGWSTAPALPLALQEIYPSAWAGGIAVAGGFTPAGDSVRAAAEAFWLPPGGLAWQPLAPLPGPRHHPFLAAHRGRLLAIGGFAATPGAPWQNRQEVWALSSPGGAWQPVAPLPFPFAETVGGVAGDTLLLATGRSPGGAANAQYEDQIDSAALLLFDGDRWQRGAPAPTPRNSAAGGILDGRLHVVGGRSGRARGGLVNHVEHEVYDPAADRWDTRAPLPAPRSGHAAAVIAGRLHALGGESFGPDGQVYYEHWAFDPRADRWQPASPMPEARHGLGLVAHAGALWAIGGATGVGARGTSTRVDTWRP